MAASLNFFCQLLLVGLIGALGYVGVSSAVAWIGFFLFMFVMLLLIAGRRFPEASANSRRQCS